MRNDNKKIITKVQEALRGTLTSGIQLPTISPLRQSQNLEVEIQTFLRELASLSAEGHLIYEGEVSNQLERLIGEQTITKATMWKTPLLERLRIREHLQALGVEIISPNASKNELAKCDLGVTEADFLLPETATVGLLASREKSRAVSLLPRIHLVIAHTSKFRADLFEVLTEAKQYHYFVLITGPSRTADIELTVTLGVHGPQKLVIWLMKDEN